MEHMTTDSHGFLLVTLVTPGTRGYYVVTLVTYGFSNIIYIWQTPDYCRLQMVKYRPGYPCI